jgi:hypothetical protein
MRPEILEKYSYYFFTFFDDLDGEGPCDAGRDLRSEASGRSSTKGSLQTLHSMKSFGYSAQHLGQNMFSSY